MAAFFRLPVQLLSASVIALFTFSVQAADDLFDATSYTCLEYINGQGSQSADRSKADLAAFWTQGFLAGYNFKNDKLSFNDEAGLEAAINADLKAACDKFPEATLVAVATELLADENDAVPSSPTNGYEPQTYTCAAFVEASSGTVADALKADLADFYAYAFVQGYVSGTDPEVILPIQSKAPVSGAMSRYCAENPDYLFLDLTKAVAPMIKTE